MAHDHYDGERDAEASESGFRHQKMVVRIYMLRGARDIRMRIVPGGPGLRRVRDPGAT